MIGWGRIDTTRDDADMADTPTPESDQGESGLARAAALHQQGSLEAAGQAYRKHLRAYPEDHRALHMFGVLRFQQGAIDDAVDLLYAATEIRDDRPDYFLNLGLVLGQASRTRDAIDAYQRALSLAPASTEAANGLAICLRRDGQTERAIDAFRRALEIDPEQPDTLNNLGVARRAAGRVREAIAAYRQALRLDPGHADAWHNLGNACMDVGETASAARAYQEALSRLPGDRQSLARLVELHADHAPDWDVDALFTELTTRGADDAELFNLWGNALRQQHRRAEAEQRYHQALQRDSANPDYLNNLGALHTHRGDHEKAAAYYRQALEAGGPHADRLFNLASACLKLGRTEDAIAHYRAALDENPKHGAAYYNLGMTYYSSARTAESAEVFAAWLRHDPDNPAAQHLAAAARGADLERAPDSYVKQEFDQFADSFDARLDKLGYRGPRLILNALPAEMRVARRSLRVLDAGCGTGLCAPGLRPLAHRLIGVDLSPGMLDRARELSLYDELVEAELGSYLSGQRQGFDLIASADTLNYFGRLDRLFTALREALVDNGLLVFTLEKAPPEELDGDYRLNPNGRFMHAESYVIGELEKAGFGAIQAGEEIIRREARQDVLAHVISARRAS